MAQVLKEGEAQPLDMAEFEQQFGGSDTDFAGLECPPEVTGGVGAEFVCTFSSSEYGDGEVTVTQVGEREVITTSIEGKLGKTVNTNFSYDAPEGSSGGELGSLTHAEGGFILEE